MKIEWKLLSISIIVGIIAASLMGLLLDSAMKGSPQSERLIISVSILIFCAFCIGYYWLVHANRELRKTQDDIQSIFSGNAIWLIPLIVVWIVALVIGHIYDSMFITNVVFWPVLIFLLILSLFVYKRKNLETKYLIFYTIFALVILPITMYVSYFAMTYEPNPLFTWPPPERINAEKWGLTIMTTGIGMAYGVLLPILSMWQIKKNKK